MGLNIKNKDVEELARQVAEATGESKTEAIRRALMERRDRLGLKSTQSVLAELEKGLANILKGRRFEPVRKDEWDRLHE
jgi:antitoxin VapB